MMPACDIYANMRKPGKGVLKLMEAFSAKHKCSSCVSKAMKELLQGCKQGNEVTRARLQKRLEKF